MPLHCLEMVDYVPLWWSAGRAHTVLNWCGKTYKEFLEDYEDTTGLHPISESLVVFWGTGVSLE